MLQKRLDLHPPKRILTLLFRSQSRLSSYPQSGNENFQNEFSKYHVHISEFQKTFLSIGAAAISILNPRRGDMIATLGEVTGTQYLKGVRNKMMDNEEGRKILMEKPRINSSTIDLDALADLPEGTLGKTYSNFLKKNNVTPDTRTHVQFVDNIELAYVIQRYREVHDLFHTVLGMPTNMLGEVTVKWVEAIQTRLPMCVSGGLFGAMRLSPKCISSRKYSTKPRLFVSLDTSVKDALDDGKIKARRHPGIMKTPPISIPSFIQKNIKNELRQHNLKDIIQGAKLLSQFLNSRKEPVENKLKFAYQEQLKNDFEARFSAEDIPDFEKKRDAYVKKRLKTNLYNWKPISYKSNIGRQYLIARAAAEYAALNKIIFEIMKRDPDFKPYSVFDFGSGVGTVAWVTHHFFQNTVEEYFSVDVSSEMNDLALKLVKIESKPCIKYYYQRQFLPALGNSSDLVFSAFSLLDLPSQDSRLEVLSNLWNRTSKYLIVVEQGTNAGFRIIEEVRQWIFHSNVECHVLAPCPHEFSCPRFSQPTPCNFPVSYYPIEVLNIHAPHSFLYSYVVLCKGARPEEDKNWSRIVRNVLTPARHTICRLCTPEGSLEEVIITKNKHGNEFYKCARKSNWGDLLPIVLSKNTPEDSKSECNTPGKCTDSNKKSESSTSGYDSTSSDSTSSDSTSSDYTSSDSSESDDESSKKPQISDKKNNIDTGKRPSDKNLPPKKK